jgi:hypothetical protein
MELEEENYNSVLRYYTQTPLGTIRYYWVG